MIRAETEPRRASGISDKEYAARIKWSGKLRRIFRTEVIDNANSLEMAEEVSRRNDGLVVVFTHFSRIDPVHMILAMAKREEIGKKNFLIPIALHQDRRKLHELGNEAAIKLMPIVTENTLKRKKYQDRKLNEGGGAYLNEAADSIKKGEVIFVSAQGEREPRLGKPKKPTMGLFMRKMKLKGIENYSILFVGFEIKGTKDYSKKKGFNFLNRYTANIGACLGSKIILERATEMAIKAGQTSGKHESLLRYVDQVIYEELSKVAPPEYR